MSDCTGASADDTYSALCKRLNELEQEAGAFLAQSLEERSEQHRSKCRGLAESIAAEANQVRSEMRVWRLEHGYDA